MNFKFNSEGKINICSSNAHTDDQRWTIMRPDKMEHEYGGRWNWFNGVMNREYERTNLYLGYDKFVRRPVIVKTINYRFDDLIGADNINKRRRVLVEQIELLNEISSPLLPEPLDWVNVKNTIDGLPVEFENTEPILVLDYIPGITLTDNILKERFRFEKNKDEMNTPRIARLALKILYFIKTLAEKNYAYVALSPEHILLLKDDIPRFVGLGRICRINNGYLDIDNVNFDRTLLGYSAPELNDYEGRRRKKITPEQIGAFSLGVILHQLVVEDTKFADEMIKDGSFIYPNGVSEEKIKVEKSGREIDSLIFRLCNHDEDKRLNDFNEIEIKLKNIAGVIISDKKNSEVKNDLGGILKFYNVQDCYGYIIDKNQKEYRINENSIKNLSSEDKHLLTAGAQLTYDMKINDNGMEKKNIYINNVAIVKNGENNKGNNLNSYSEKVEKTIDKSKGNINYIDKFKKLFKDK